jgi:hypothetical protein
MKIQKAVRTDTCQSANGLVFIGAIHYPKFIAKKYTIFSVADNFLTKKLKILHDRLYNQHAVAVLFH